MFGICSECGQEAEVIKVDNGIGVTEAWGVRSRHTDYCAETRCCNAPATDSEGQWITLRDLEEEDNECKYSDYC
jgi:hypothetical protein